MNIKRCLFVCLFVLTIWSENANAVAKDNFVRFGDVFRLLPVFVAVVSIGMEDYRGFGELVAGSLATQGTIEIIKWGFHTAHKKNLDVGFAKRPCCEDYRGFPSGHAGGAFSAAGFVYYRYGWKPAFAVTALAILTSASRVYAQKHSILQVVAGGTIAWGFSWLLTSKYKPKNFIIMPTLDLDAQDNISYGLNLAYQF